MLQEDRGAKVMSAMEWPRWLQGRNSPLPPLNPPAAPTDVDSLLAELDGSTAQKNFSAQTKLPSPEDPEATILRHPSSGSEVVQRQVSMSVPLNQTLLGEGSRAKVYAVEHSHDGRQYVVKLVKLSKSHPLKVARSEAQIHARMQHSAVVRYYYSSAENDTFSLLLEYSGSELSCQLPFHSSDLFVRKRWVAQLADGLMHVHEQGVIHRDLSPRNIFVSRNQNLRIGDFGLSLLTDEAERFAGRHEEGFCPLRESDTNSVYRAPELGSDEGYGLSVDIFSMGMIFFAIFAECTDPEALDTALEYMREPQQGRTYTDPQFGAYSVLNSIQQPLRDVIVACLERQPECRPTAVELQWAIATWLLSEDHEDTSLKSDDAQHRNSKQTDCKRRKPIGQAVAGADKSTCCILS